MARLFRDRYEAGRELAGELAHYAGRRDVQVLAVLAAACLSPLRWPGPWMSRSMFSWFASWVFQRQKELAMGAIAMGGVRLLNTEIVRRLKIPPEVLERITRDEREELRTPRTALSG